MPSSTHNIESELRAHLAAVNNDTTNSQYPLIQPASTGVDQTLIQPASTGGEQTLIQPASTAVDQTQIHPELRGPPTPNMVPTANMMGSPRVSIAPMDHSTAVSVSAGTPGNPILAAANLSQVAPAPVVPGAEPAPNPPPPTDGRRTKRELSSTKRAAQNRAAQRAFRQRKETYIKKLEADVKDMEDLKRRITDLSSENYQLREFILMQQTRIIQLGGEPPVLPPGLSSSAHVQQQVSMVETAETTHEAPAPVNNLEVIAQAVNAMPTAGASYKQERTPE